jgi:hypothetical protein
MARSITMASACLLAEHGDDFPNGAAGSDALYGQGGDDVVKGRDLIRQ